MTANQEIIAELRRVLKERDEARASVADAYRRGAEAMREACARVVDAAEADGRQCVRVSVMADDIRALPIPEEP
jgi:hypothetical protein